VETPTDQLDHLTAEPYLQASGKPDPTSVNIETLLSNNAKPVTVTLKGYHLDALQSVQFAKAADDKSKGSVTPFKIAVDQGATASQAQVTMTTANVKSGNISGDFTSQNLELSISLISKKAPNTPVVTKQVLYGTGKVAAATSVPAGGAKSSVSLSAKKLSFGPQNVATTSAAKSLTLTNKGSSPLTQIAVKLSGAKPDDFVPENNPCKGTVEANGKCIIAVQFKPSTSGTISATFSISYLIGGAQQTESVSLTGTGTLPSATSNSHH
jgi:hypothetical protein